MVNVDEEKFVAASSDVFSAQSIINECILRVKQIEITGSSNYEDVKSKVEFCGIEKIVEQIQDERNWLSQYDEGFALTYFNEVNESIQIASNDFSQMRNQMIEKYGEDFQSEMTEEESKKLSDLYLEIEVSQREQNLAIIEVLERQNDLTDELKQELDRRKLIEEKYKIKDQMSRTEPASEEYKELYMQYADYDRGIIENNPNLTAIEKEILIEQYNNTYERTLLEIDYQIELDDLIDDLKGLDINDKDYQEKYYKISAEINQRNIEYYESLGVSNLNEQQLTILQQQRDYKELNELYLDGDKDLIRQKKVAMGIATEDEIEYENADWFGRFSINANTVCVTAITSLGGIGEAIIDGSVMLTLGTVGLFNEDAARATKDFVSVNWSKEAYDGWVETGELNSYSAYSGYHTVTDFATKTLGYAGLSMIPGLGGSILMATAGAGSTAQTAFDNGASFQEAYIASSVSAALAFASDVGLDKLNASGASLGTKIIGRTAIGAGEPLINTVAEYLTFGNNKEGQSFHEYAKASGAYWNIGAGFAISNLAGLASDYKIKKIKSSQLEVSPSSEYDMSKFNNSKITGKYKNANELYEAFIKGKNKMNMQEYAQAMDFFKVRDNISLTNKTGMELENLFFDDDYIIGVHRVGKGNTQSILDNGLYLTGHQSSGAFTGDIDLNRNITFSDDYFGFVKDLSEGATYKTGGLGYGDAVIVKIPKSDINDFNKILDFDGTTYKLKPEYIEGYVRSSIGADGKVVLGDVTFSNKMFDNVVNPAISALSAGNYKANTVSDFTFDWKNVTDYVYNLAANGDGVYDIAKKLAIYGDSCSNINTKRAFGNYAFEFLVSNGMDSKTASNMIGDIYEGINNSRGFTTVAIDKHGIKYNVINDFNNANQAYDIKSIAEQIDNLPLSVKQNISDINIYDTFNPWDYYWKAEYNYDGYFVSAATGGNGSINVWANEFKDISTIPHESAHCFDVNRRYSESPEYLKAINNDKKMTGLESVTDYGRNNSCEDFAETFALYQEGHPSALADISKFPNRRSFIERVMGYSTATLDTAALNDLNMVTKTLSNEYGYENYFTILKNYLMTRDLSYIPPIGSVRDTINKMDANVVLDYYNMITGG
ncbi:MAG: hypothetical protein E7165_03890 [Firmicutes bacterium]|nr:hypothetical protein [Bacillota bacterium]